MEAIKLKPQILTKEFNSIPQSQRTPKVKDNQQYPKRERNYRNKWLQVREKEKGYEQVMPVFCSYLVTF